MAKQLLDQDEIEQLPVGSRVSDWENDVLEQESPGVWMYVHQPMRRSVPRGFDPEVLHRAYGPVTLMSVPKLAVAEGQDA